LKIGQYLAKLEAKYSDTFFQTQCILINLMYMQEVESTHGYNLICCIEGESF